MAHKSFAAEIFFARFPISTTISTAIQPSSQPTNQTTNQPTYIHRFFFRISPSSWLFFYSSCTPLWLLSDGKGEHMWWFRVTSSLFWGKLGSVENNMSGTIEAWCGDLWTLDTSLHRINIVLKAFETVELECIRFLLVQNNQLLLP